MTTSRSPGPSSSNRRGSAKPIWSTSPSARAGHICSRFRCALEYQEPVTDVLVRRGDQHVMHSRRREPRCAPVRSQLSCTGGGRAEGRIAGREGRASSRHPAASAPKSPAQRDRSGAAAAVSRPVPRRNQKSGARMPRPPARSARPDLPRDYSAAQRTIEWHCGSKTSSMKKRSWALPGEANWKRRSQRSPCSARCRSR